MLSEDDQLNILLSEIKNEGADVTLIQTLYIEERNQELFEYCIKQDLVECVSYLYTNNLGKFYIQEFVNNMDQNLFETLNLEDNVNLAKVYYKNTINKSLEYLNYMKRYSTLKKDKKGFYYEYK